MAWRNRTTQPYLSPATSILQELMPGWSSPGYDCELTNFTGLTQIATVAAAGTSPARSELSSYSCLTALSESESIHRAQAIVDFFEHELLTDDEDIAGEDEDEYEDTPSTISELTAPDPWSLFQPGQQPQQSSTAFTCHPILPNTTANHATSISTGNSKQTQVTPHAQVLSNVTVQREFQDDNDLPVQQQKSSNNDFANTAINIFGRWIQSHFSTATYPVHNQKQSKSCNDLDLYNGSIEANLGQTDNRVSVSCAPIFHMVQQSPTSNVQDQNPTLQNQQQQKQHSKEDNYFINGLNVGEKLCIGQQEESNSFVYQSQSDNSCNNNVRRSFQLDPMEFSPLSIPEEAEQEQSTVVIHHNASDNPIHVDQANNVSIKSMFQLDPVQLSSIPVAGVEQQSTLVTHYDSTDKPSGENEVNRKCTFQLDPVEFSPYISEDDEPLLELPSLFARKRQQFILNASSDDEHENSSGQRESGQSRQTAFITDANGVIAEEQHQEESPLLAQCENISSTLSSEYFTAISSPLSYDEQSPPNAVQSSIRNSEFAQIHISLVHDNHDEDADAKDDISTKDNTKTNHIVKSIAKDQAKSKVNNAHQTNSTTLVEDKTTTTTTTPTTTTTSTTTISFTFTPIYTPSSTSTTSTSTSTSTLTLTLYPSFSTPKSIPITTLTPISTSTCASTTCISFTFTPIYTNSTILTPFTTCTTSTTTSTSTQTLSTATMFDANEHVCTEFGRFPLKGLHPDKGHCLACEYVQMVLEGKLCRKARLDLSSVPPAERNRMPKLEQEFPPELRGKLPSCDAELRAKIERYRHIIRSRIYRRQLRECRPEVYRANCERKRKQWRQRMADKAQRQRETWRQNMYKFMPTTRGSRIRVKMWQTANTNHNGTSTNEQGQPVVRVVNQTVATCIDQFQPNPVGRRPKCIPKKVLHLQQDMFKAKVPVAVLD